MSFFVLLLKKYGKMRKSTRQSACQTGEGSVMQTVFLDVDSAWRSEA